MAARNTNRGVAAGHSGAKSALGLVWRRRIGFKAAVVGPEAENWFGLRATLRAFLDFGRRELPLPGRRQPTTRLADGERGDERAVRRRIERSRACVTRRMK